MTYQEDNDDKLLVQITGIKGFLSKIFLFFMGFLPGICLLHMFLILFSNSGDFSIYAENSLRINQLIQICSLYSSLGSIFCYTENKKECKISTYFGQIYSFRGQF